MNMRYRRSATPTREPASGVRDRIGEVIDGEVPTTDEEWALLDTIATLRGGLSGEPPPGLVDAVWETAHATPEAPRRRPTAGALVSWARRRLDRRRDGRRPGLLGRSSARRAERTADGRRSL